MPKAMFNDTVIAESESTEVVEGNHYFPPGSVKDEHFTKTDKTTRCPWKGDASYFTVEVDGARAENAAWTYESPKEEAAQIKDHVAFWGDVGVSD